MRSTLTSGNRAANEGQIEAPGTGAKPAIAKTVVEIARTFIITFVLARVMALTGVDDLKSAVQLALWLWFDFSAMMWVAAIMWEETPWRIAAIRSDESHWRSGKPHPRHQRDAPQLACGFQPTARDQLPILLTSESHTRNDSARRGVVLQLKSHIVTGVESSGVIIGANGVDMEFPAKIQLLKQIPYFLSRSPTLLRCRIARSARLPQVYTSATITPAK
jgi:hypothetical protein